MVNERSNESKVQVWKNGQVMITVPRAIAGAINVRKGDKMSWNIEQGRLWLERVRD